MSAISTDTTGMTPTKVVDVLDQDPEIRNQKFVLLSFVSPEQVLLQKEPFMLNEFLQSFASEMNTMIDSWNEYFKDHPDIKQSISLIKQRYDYIWSGKALQQEFEFYKQQNHDALESEYLKRNNFQTTVRGIKVRGTYETLDEAKARVDAIRKIDKNFNIYIGQVGCWCPWSPYPEVLEKSEYCETALNSLVKEYQENQDLRQEIYDQRKEDLTKKIAEEMAERKDNWLARKEEIATTAEITDPVPEPDAFNASDEIYASDLITITESSSVPATNEVP